MTGYEKMEALIEVMGKEALLNELLAALSEDELKENAEWIATMNDIDLD